MGAAPSRVRLFFLFLGDGIVNEHQPTESNGEYRNDASGQLNRRQGRSAKCSAVQRNCTHAKEQEILQRKGPRIDPSHWIPLGKPIEKPHAEKSGGEYLQETYSHGRITKA